MALTLTAVTFDCTDALVIGRFWSDVLGRPLDTGRMEPSPFFASIGVDGGAGNGFMFIQVPEGKTVKNRVHLDFHTATEAEFASEKARVLALGATHVHDKAEYGITWTTFADPEGNEFCIGGPHG